GDGGAVPVHTLEDHMLVPLGIVNVNGTGDFGHDGHGLGTAALEEFLNTGKTLGNILGGCDTTGMEGTHGQLSTGLADGLSCNDAYGLTYPDGLAVGQVG